MNDVLMNDVLVKPERPSRTQRDRLEPSGAVVRTEDS